MEREIRCPYMSCPDMTSQPRHGSDYELEDFILSNSLAAILWWTPSKKSPEKPFKPQSYERSS